MLQHCRFSAMAPYDMAALQKGCWGLLAAASGSSCSRPGMLCGHRLNACLPLPASAPIAACFLSPCPAALVRTMGTRTEYDTFGPLEVPEDK